MASDLRFDITARDQASGEFAAIAAQLKTLARQLDQLDRKKAAAKVEVTGAKEAQTQISGLGRGLDDVDRKRAAAKVAVTGVAESQAQVKGLGTQLRDVDGRFVKAQIDVNGTAQAQASLIALAAQLSGIPKTTTTTVKVDVDKTVGDRIRGLADDITRLHAVAQASVAGFQTLRSVAGGLIDPNSIPVVERLSNAISSRFHAAVQAVTPAVTALKTGLSGVHDAVVGVAAAGNAITFLSQLATSLGQVAGVAAPVPSLIMAIVGAATTFKISMSGFSDAVNAKDMKAFAEATKDMPPAMVAAASAVRQLNDGPIADLKRSVQANFWSGFADGIRQVATAHLPTLKSAMSGIAAAMNGMGRSLMSAISAPQIVAAVKAVGDGTASALSNMRTSLANAATGFVLLGGAGASVLPQIGAAIDNAARSFRTFAEAAVESGQFDRWVANGTAALRQLGAIAGNVGAILAQVFAALDGSGAGLFATLAQLTGELRTFLSTAQGAQSLAQLASVVKAAGDAVRTVLIAALHAALPIMAALAPAAAAVATALGEHLAHTIEMLSPLLQRLATFLGQHPQLLANIAIAAGAVTAAFGPMTAAIALAAGVLKTMVLARITATVLSAIGLSGTAAGIGLLAMVSPLAALRQSLPIMASLLGNLSARLVLLMGPLAWLIATIAVLYASSSQFRDAFNTFAGAIGNTLVGALKVAAAVIAETVNGLSQFGSAISGFFSQITGAGSAAMSVFGPLGAVLSGLVTTFAAQIGQATGIALAAYAAFTLFGKITPIFVQLSAAVAAFGARMTAYSAATVAGAAATNLVGAAATRAAGVITKLGAALPGIGVALIALGAAAQAASIDFDGLVQKLSAGSLSMAQAQRQAAEEATTGWTGFVNFLEGDLAQAGGLAMDELKKKTDEYRASLGPLQQLEFDVARAQAELNDAVVQYGAASPQARAAAQELAVATAKSADAHKAAAEMAKTQAERERELADQLRSQIGAMLDYAESVRRTAEAHKEAGEALTKSGKNSEEYKKATEEIIRSADRQAEAARSQAKAWGATDDGVKAYNTELLRAFDLSKTQGRDAFIAMASGLDQTTLNAISTAAAFSGLRTEVIKLPGGKTVTVVVAADQGKLPEVRRQLDEVAQRKYVGRVEIIAETENLRGDIDRVLRLADGTTAQMHISAENGQAIVTINGTKYLVDNTTGQIRIAGDVAPGQADLTGMVLQINGTTATLQMDANAAAAEAKRVSQVQLANGSVGTMTLDARPDPATGKINGTVAYGNGQTATVTIDGNQTPSDGKIDATIRYGNGQTATIKVDANAAGANAALDNAARPRTAVITVVYQGLERNINPAYGGGRITGAGGGVVGFAGGGVVAAPRRFARGGYIPGYRPGVDDVPALLSRGEAVIVPELVRRLGAGRILAANAEASGGRPAMRAGSLAGLMDGAIGRTQAVTIQPRPAAGPSVSVAAPNLSPIVARLAQLEATLTAALAQARPITVVGGSNPTETARATQLAMRV